MDEQLPVVIQRCFVKQLNAKVWQTIWRLNFLLNWLYFQHLREKKGIRLRETPGIFKLVGIKTIKEK